MTEMLEILYFALAGFLTRYPRNSDDGDLNICSHASLAIKILSLSHFLSAIRYLHHLSSSSFISEHRHTSS